MKKFKMLLLLAAVIGVSSAFTMIPKANVTVDDFIGIDIDQVNGLLFIERDPSSSTQSPLPHEVPSGWTKGSEYTCENPQVVCTVTADPVNLTYDSQNDRFEVSVDDATYDSGTFTVQP